MVKDRYIEIAGNSIRYWQEGTAGPVVLLVHGIAASVEYWMRNIAVLAQKFRVFAVDLPGFGRSAQPKMEFTAKNLAKFLAEFLAAHNLSQVSLVGHSLGGAVCLQFALDYPQLLQKLVLVDSAGFGQELPFSLRILTLPFLGRLLLKFNHRRLVAAALRAYAVKRRALDEEFITRMYAILQLPGAKETMLTILRQHATIFGVKSRDIRNILTNLPKVTAPTLVLWGREDRLLPLCQAQQALTKLPNAQLHIFDNCGHIPQFEVQNQFNHLVSEFLSQ